MIRSMTGFGEAAADTPAGRLRAEIRTVNHRYFNPSIRLARGIEKFEPQVREWLRSHLSRGHIHFTLRIDREDDAETAGSLRVDHARARQYVDALNALRDELGLSGAVDVSLLSRFSDVLAWEEEAEVEVEADAVRGVTEAAAAAAARMRDQEGLRLAADLEGRLAAIETALTDVTVRAPLRLEVERDRMRRVVAELLDGAMVDEDRIAREIAMIAERWDVSEEIVRLRSHIELFRESLSSDAAEPVGKRLGFLIQEMNREINTIGAKANDAPMEHAVIAMKEEVERLREQVENVE
jgi:uncharacterized protein (TIGR00255 family)